MKFTSGNPKLELDDFADALGIELVSCIQTLAHLCTAIPWKYMESKMYQHLARALSARCEAAVALHAGYKKKNPKQFHTAAVLVWSRECKGQGMEIIDLRLGGVQARCQALVQRLKLYQEGMILSQNWMNRNCPIVVHSPKMAAPPGVKPMVKSLLPIHCAISSVSKFIIKYKKERIYAHEPYPLRLHPDEGVPTSRKNDIT